MYLKSLELHGFKSFPDKVTLEFGKGLTAVVGPNGSGKSNIGDAVRWVLGEQSSKTLRGGKMEDVIFGGTQQRKPVSFASVTLNIVNDDRTLAVESDTVSVTRKLYRNGDSEYLINGNPVRLRDIVEMFMDTGLGRDGYSIIGQGRVADIVGSKSAERREIFEEAAGISKFRYKKAESERRLASAEDNILRLRDILSELEGRVEPLRIQSEKAKKYLVLAESRKSLEIAVWTRRLQELKGNLDELEDKLLAANAEYEHLGNEIDKCDEEIADLSLKRQQCTAVAEEYRDRISALEADSASAAADIAVFNNNIQHYNDLIAETEQRKSELSLGDAQLRERIAEKQKLIEDIAEQRGALESDILGLEDRLSKLTLEADEFERSLSGSNDALNKLYIKKSELSFASANSDITRRDLEKTLEDERASLEQGRAAVEAVDAEREQILKEIAEAEEISREHTNRLNGFQMLYNKKDEQLKKLNTEFNDAELNIRNLTQRRQMLIDLENSMEGFAGSVRQIIKAGRNGQLRGVKGTVAQIVSVEQKYSLAIETALGGALQNIVVDNEDTAKRGIRILKETNGGRATFLPITSVKGNTLTEKNLDMQEGYVALASELVSYESEYQGIVNSLLGRIVIAEDIDLATNIAKKYGYKFRIITLDGQVINAGGSFTGGSSQRSSGVLSRKNEIKTISDQLGKLTSSHEVMKQRLGTLSSEVEKLGYDLEGERDMISRADTEKVRLEGEHKRVEQLKEQYDLRIAELEKSVKENEARISAAIDIKSSSTEELAQCEKDISELEALVASAQERTGEARGIREQISADISDKRLRLAELAKDIQSAEDAILQLEQSIENSAAEAKRFDDRIAELKTAIDNENTALSERKREAEEAKASAEALGAKIKEELARGMEYERQSQIVRSLQRSKSDEKETVSSEISRITERRDNLKKDSDEMITQLWESYSLTVAEAAEQAEDIEDVTDAQKRLNELKSRIRALGSVNTEAIDEYNEVLSRYEFLSAQLNDVLQSKEELEKLIASLTKSMREIFTDSFNKINENFKTTFVELFGGGRAELALTDPENVLESGIEINVAPPGKVIKNLSLLSGGEQAFVAIAIYFAILKLRPSPFCILDEIEAALDDVNVSRYAQYLRNFTGTTQFILITHRRGTMEEADILYGVTMQEKGVSKLLRMDISEVQDTETH